MKKLLLLLPLVLSLLLPSCSRGEPIRESMIQLGTLTEITVYDEKDRPAVAEAFALIDEKQAIFDMHGSVSELARLNATAHDHPVAVSDELYSLIRKSLEIADLTDGAFDPAIGPLVDLWKIGSDDARVPSDDEIAAVLPLLDWHDVMLDDDAGTVYFRKVGMSLDLGGIAKGYISGCVSDFLKERGVERAVINLGGNVQVVGEKDDGRPWKVGLRNPLPGAEGIFTMVEATDEAVLTSGGYERYFQPEEGGPIYHHILDIRTGWPAESDVVSVTVISCDAALADALSTACFVMGKEKAQALLDLVGARGVFLDAEGDMFTSGASEL